MTLGEELDRLSDAAEAARSIGLVDAADRAEAVVARTRERAGFPGDVYVLALAGGTGVGKSSVLNALAGRAVSAVRAVRPTTQEPIAWVGEARRHDLAPLLGWVGVELLAGHTDDALAGVAILDLPDVDSIHADHRATVDALLPRIDAVAWVVDPEKYDDERLHTYLRSLSPHAERMRFVLNKADRLTDEQRRLVVEDLRARLAASGIRRPRIDVVSAVTGAGLAELRADLTRAADTKSLVIAKLTTDVREQLARLGGLVGLEPRRGYAPLVSPERRARALSDALGAAVALVDPPGIARQVQAAVLGRARRRGGSLLGRAVGLLGSLTGHSSRTADPGAYLRNWRLRGSLGSVTSPIRGALVAASGSLPVQTRAALLAANGDDSEREVAGALDRVAREAAETLRLGASPVWTLIGVLQLAAGAVFLFAVAWYLTLFLAPVSVAVATVEVALLGPVPLPLLLLAGSVLVSAVLGWLLSAHAGWVGRRHGRRIATHVREAVTDVVETVAMARLDTLEAVRRRIAGV